MKTLHFILDPQCGWCYAAAPLIDALIERSDIDINMHGGGLFSGTNKRILSADFHQQIMAMDQRITTLTGQIFSQTYYANILADKHRIVDSDIPTTALLAARSIGINPITMLHKIQIAQFVKGRSQSDIGNLTAIAAELGASTSAFLKAFTDFSGKKTAQHIAQSRHMLELVAGNGFPTLAFEHADGAFTKLDHSAYYGQPQQWVKYVERVMKTIA